MSNLPKKAFITGITETVRILRSFYLRKGMKFMVVESSRDPFSRLASIKDRIHIHYGDLRDLSALERVMATANPDEIYNLAAQSDVGISFTCPEETYEIDYAGVGRLVQAAMSHNKNVRIYQASTSEMFGSTQPPQNETSIFAPVSPYGEAKKKAHEDYVKGYRDQHGLFICSGILFNHESPRRGEHFVTRKITLSLAKIREGQQEILSLGNLDAKRDWGFAGDYVVAMWKMLQQDAPEDFVIATGEQHSVRDFVEAAGTALGMTFSWEGTGVEEIGRDQNGVVRITVNPKYYRPREVHSLLGDPSKAKRLLDWKPETSFEELVRLMAEADLASIKHGLLVT